MRLPRALRRPAAPSAVSRTSFTLTGDRATEKLSGPRNPHLGAATAALLAHRAPIAPRESKRLNLNHHLAAVQPTSAR